MAMPDFAGAWPPKPWDEAARQWDVYTAWWSGDVEALEGIYSDPNYVAPRPSQLRGGVVGRASRFWFGKPMLQDQKRLHVPAAADVATTSADLLFGQPPSWLLSKGDASDLEGAQKRLNEIMDDADTVAVFLEAAETQAALCGVYLRLVWDVQFSDKVMVSAVPPDAAIPVWKFGKLAEVTFWTVVAEDKRGVWRHLEHHSPGAIEHRLYLGDKGMIGREMELDSLPAMQWAADIVNEQSIVETGIDRLTAAYIPNVRPARRWRNEPHLAPLGRSDFEGVEHLFDALDEVWSSWMRDIDIAKGRLFVAQELLEDQGPGKGSTWDPEQQIFTPVPSDQSGSLNDNGAPQLVQAQQFKIRVEEHSKTCEKILKEILRACGYSAGDFDDSDAAAMTATEVSARKDKSNATRNRKILYWQSETQKFARTALLLDGIVFKRGDYGLTADPEMKFPVRVDQDPVQLSTAINNLRTARAASTETLVRMFHPNWSNDEVKEEITRILEEQDPEMPDAAENPAGDAEADAATAVGAQSNQLNSDEETSQAA
ncbi:phage portal protein [Nocardia wallacei]|uniref:phage portal protein n=1 Tax=Nocardia wallacei TaxID=480035 RepID=UPI002456BE0B|nr:phage portal protein [Nocardia wallacei]